MLSFKRLLYIVLAVAALGVIFLIYSVNDSRLARARMQNRMGPEREFVENGQPDEGEKPRVWILGDPEDGRCGEIYSNVLQLSKNLHLTVAGEGYLKAEEIKERDLVIFCDDSIRPYADPAELEDFIVGGGRVILAAGLAAEDEDSGLWPVFGIQELSSGEDCHDLLFEKSLLPVQPEQACYDGDSDSARIEVGADATVYLRDAGNDTPILYTYAWQQGSVCLLNGTFLTDARCMGLLTGAIGTLLPDFVYPVLGVKAVFLDHFLTVTSADDEVCRRMYGYSAEGFVRDVVWPVFQGISLRTDTPYTASISAASSKENSSAADEERLTDIDNSVLQFGGELVHAADCPKEGESVYKLPAISGADDRFVRGILGSDDVWFSWEDGRTVFPAATAGNSMEDGNLFALYSVLGAYGMISHVFDAGMLFDREGDDAVWDLDKRQIGFFESDVLAYTTWLEGRTLTRIGDDVRSYQNLDYGWVRKGSRMEFACSGAVKGQAFFYHTDDRVVDAEGLDYQDVGNGYYLLRIQENHGSITLEEGM